MQDICKKRLYALIDKIEKVDVDEKQIEPFLPYILKKLNWLDREKLIKHFVSTEFNRYLSYYKNSKDINFEGYSEGGSRFSEKRRNRSNNRSRKRNRNQKFFQGKNKGKNENRSKRRRKSRNKKNNI